MARGGAVRCGKCGTANPGARIFCRSCGARLDLSGPDRGPGSSRRAFTGGLRLGGALGAAAVLLGAGAALGSMLALWPVDAVCDGRLSLGKARSCRNKLSELEAALEEGKSAAVWFDEDEINSYLAGLIWARRLPMPPYWRVCVEAAVLDLTGGGFRMTARILWGPLRATLRLTGTSGGPAYDAALVVKSLAIGRLPLPPRWTGAVVQALAGDAGELERVRRILENLVLIRLEDHRMLCGV